MDVASCQRAPWACVKSKVECTGGEQNSDGATSCSDMGELCKVGESVGKTNKTLEARSRLLKGKRRLCDVVFRRHIELMRVRHVGKRTEGAIIGREESRDTGMSAEESSSRTRCEDYIGRFDGV